MYKLFYSPGACSLAVHVVLNELEQNHELVNSSIMDGKNRTPEFLQINPRGQVPVLVDGDKVIREGAAILIYLIEKHNSNLLGDKNNRADAIEWLMFCNATLHPAYSRGFFLMRNAKDEKDQLLATAVAAINNLWSEVEARLEKHKYLAGDNLTVADILLTVIANWSPRFPGINIGPKTKNLLKNVSQLPAYQKALGLEQVEYKAA